LAVGDISSAFLQGKPRDVNEPLFMEPPRGLQLKGMGSQSCLLRVVKGVFGLPDAPRAWWLEFSRALTEEMGMVATQVDQALFAWRNASGQLGLVLAVHVDDIIVAHDGSPEARAVLDKLGARFPFGDWQLGVNGPLSYTGKTIEVVAGPDGAEVHVHQKDFIRGRLESMKLERKGRQVDDEVTPTEASDFKSMCGSLCWLAGLSRPDVAQETNMLQKRQAAPRYRDCQRAVKLIESIKRTEDVVLRIRPIKGEMCVACFTDSALYNSYDESAVSTDEELKQVEKELLRSQHGVLVTIMSAQELDAEGGVASSPMDWMTHASRRVVRSTFSAETGAALEAFGRGAYVRALLSELQAGPIKLPHTWGEEVVKLRIVTDCKSLYDNIAKECSVCEDRHTALYIASLRQGVSAGPQRDSAKAGLLWVPSRHQLADGLTKDGLGQLIRDYLSRGTCYLHEVSAQAKKREALRVRSQDQSGQEESGTSVNQLSSPIQSALSIWSRPTISTTSTSSSEQHHRHIYIYIYIYITFSSAGRCGGP